MKKRYLSILRQMWLFTSLAFLFLPIFKSYTGSYYRLTDDLAMIAVTMFFLSLPFSLAGLPVIVFFLIAMREMLPPAMIMYLTSVMFFVFGVIQWYWIIPGWPRKGPEIQTLGLPVERPFMLPEQGRTGILDSEARTPFERIIYDYAEK